MCTVTWRTGPDGYDLFFNRDELNSRAPELPPALSEKHGIKFIAPRDGDHGGTWLSVNEYGLTVCLLNDYANPWRPMKGASLFSRGHLVLACAQVKNISAVVEIIGHQPLARTMPFRVMAISPTEDPLLLHWTGTNLHRIEGASVTAPLSSSSYATDEVVSARQARLREYVRVADQPEVSELAAYHRQHSPAAGAHSVLMSRPDAATRSIIHVRVDSSQVECIYQSVRQSAQGPALNAPLTVALNLKQVIDV